MRRGVATLAVSAAGLLLGGCTTGFDRNDQIVDSLRILGVGAHVDDPSGMHIDWADADAGDTVHLRALVSNPGGLSTVTVTWLACLPVEGQSQPCTDPAYLRDPTKIIDLQNDPTSGVVQLGTGVDVDVQVPDALAPLMQMLLDRADAHVNAQCALYTQIPLLVIAQDNPPTGPVFAAVKNLRLSPWKEIAAAPTPNNYGYYVRNRNPTITAFDIPSSADACDGQPLATVCFSDADCPSGATCQDNHFCRPSAAAFPAGPQSVCLKLDTPDSYYTCGLDGPQIANPGDPPNVPEQPDVTWYMTGGSLSGYPAPMNGSGGSVTSRTFTHFTRPDGPFTIYGVVRDHRDGETWIAQDFQ